MRGRKSPAQCGNLAAPLLLSALLVACAAPRQPPAEPAPAPAEPAETEPAISLPAGLSPTLPDAGRLLGLEPRRIQDVLGAPSLVRREGTAQVMQFKNGNCVLDVIFYEETPGGAFRARHLTSRLTNGTPHEPQACLAVILPGGQFPVGMFPEESSPQEPEPDQEESAPGDTPPS